MAVNTLKAIKQKETLVLFVDDKKKILGGWTDAALKEYLKVPLQNDFEGKFKETLLIYLHSHPFAKRVLLVGVGKNSELSRFKLRCLASPINQALEERKLTTSIGLLIPNLSRLKAAEIVEDLEIGLQLTRYRFRELRKDPKDRKEPKLELEYIAGDASEKRSAEKGLERGQKSATAVNWARRLINLSGLQLPPTELVKEAQKMVHKSAVKNKIKSEVWTEKELKQKKFGGILAVGAGSDNPPRFLILEYRNAKKSEKPVVLVGKGITFDTGGLSLKPPQGQETMKYDMAGAASVLGAFKLVTDLQLKKNVVALIPMAENMPSGKAIRPGDIITMASGTTVEVLNTDAEGRLILGDALYYGTTQYKPKAVINVATLTGSCKLAVGQAAAGMFGNEKKLKDQLLKASSETAENIWPLPDFDHFYADLLKSDVADLKNIGGRDAGATTAGIFLRHFIQNQAPWAHLDIAGCGWYEQPRDYIGVRGPSGMTVRLLAHFIEKNG